MTGCDPGAHGIHGFTDVTPEMRLKFPSFDDIRRPVIWNRIGGKRSVIVNLPFTYPARPLNGILIAGFVVPVFDRAVFPQSLLLRLKMNGYRVDVDAVKGRTDRRGLIDDLFRTLAIHEETMLSLAATEAWDLFVGVITGTDRLHHFFFDAATDAAHPYHGDFVEYYRKVDTFVGKFEALLPSDTRFILLSDHGFTLLETQIYVNTLLRSLGYLSFVTNEPKGLEHIHPQSSAFAMDPGRIYLNRRSRFRTGRLSDMAASELSVRLKTELERITIKSVVNHPLDRLDPHTPLFQAVKTREELYPGADVDSTADLVIIPYPGIDLKASFGSPHIAGRDIFTGTHTHDDAFVIVTNPEGSKDFVPHIENVADLILSSLN